MYGDNYMPEPKELRDSEQSEEDPEENEEDMEARILRALGL